MFLGLDLGTTNTKALLLDDAGRIAAHGSAAVPMRHGPGGTVEQDIEQIWSSTLDALRQIAGGGLAGSVRAVGVSSQGGALVVLDGEGRPVGPVISWMDGRAAATSRELTQELGAAWFRRHTGHGACGVAAGQMAHLRRHCPNLLSPPHRIGFVGDVIVGRLCGRAATDATSFSISVLFNPWLGQVDPDLLKHLGIERTQLPEQLEPREPAGGIAPDIARLIGLPAGIPVSTAIHDQYAAALGCGCVRKGDLMFGAGTAWVLLAIGDRLLEPVIDEAFVCTHLIDGLWGQLLSMGNGGSAVSWILRTLGLKLDAEGLDRLIEEAPAGCDGVRCWPLLAPGGGAKVPGDPGGRLSGLRLSHAPGHIVRAVVEGLALELARYLNLLKEGGVPVQRLVMCGGGAASRVTPQIVADACGLPVARVTRSDTSALGAAVLARGLVQPDSSLAELALAMVCGAGQVAPGDKRTIYRILFSEYLAALGL